MNRRLVIVFLVITTLGVLVFCGCGVTKAKETIKKVSSDTQKKPENSNKKDTIDGPFSQLKYDITSISSNTKIELNTPWEQSPLGKFKVTLEGKGEKAREEGYSHIIIKDEQSGKLQKLTLVNEEKNQFTAKDLEWIDENNMLIIIGDPFGSVSMGGKIYKLNILSGEASLYVNTTSTKEEFIAVHKSADGFTFEKYVYDDNNFTKGHTESGILELK